MQCALLPGLIWKDARDSVHQPSAFLSFSLLPFFSLATIPLFLFKSLFSPLFSLLHIYSSALSHIIEYDPSFSLPSLSVIFFSACLSVRRTFLLASSSVDCSLNLLSPSVCVPHYKDQTDQNQACISGGHCVPWPHPHSALGYSVWA